jgi:four helix bundle protein
MRKDIEKRLIKLALQINDLCRYLKASYLSRHMTKQLIRSSTSAALNYGEAQGAESRKDFIHKSSIVLKELRETKISTLLIRESIKPDAIDKLDDCIDECDQLIAIFYKTVMTARKKK